MGGMGCGGGEEGEYAEIKFPLEMEGGMHGELTTLTH